MILEGRSNKISQLRWPVLEITGTFHKGMERLGCCQESRIKSLQLEISFPAQRVT